MAGWAGLTVSSVGRRAGCRGERGAGDGLVLHDGVTSNRSRRQPARCPGTREGAWATAVRGPLGARVGAREAPAPTRIVPGMTGRPTLTGGTSRAGAATSSAALTSAGTIARDLGTHAPAVTHATAAAGVPVAVRV